MSVVAAAVAMALFVRYQRHRVAMDASGEWWCSGDICGLSACDPGRCVSQPRAACFSFRAVMSGRNDNACWSLMSYCEDGYVRALKDRDVDDVGACRLVSATTEDRQRYHAYVIFAWLIGAAALAVLAHGAWRWWRSRAPAHP